MKKLLWDNALEAWAMAIRYCDHIMAGKVTFINRKYFVSSLQNAIELFVKQHMLDVCDYRVAEVRNYDSKGEPIREYLHATDLNAYFSDIYNANGTMKGVYTIGFNKIINIQEELFAEFYSQKPKEYKENIASALEGLKTLRNDETHFFIDADDFLKDKEFESLHNLMVYFYEILEFYDLLPFWGEPINEDKRFAFKRAPLSNFSFEERVESSDFAKKLKENVERELFFANAGETAYSMARNIVEFCDAYSEDDFDDVWTYLQVLLKYHILEIPEIPDEHYIDE